MHLCHEEIFALLAALPFIGGAIVKLRHWWHGKFGCKHPTEVENSGPRVGVVSEGPPDRSLAEIFMDPPKLQLLSVAEARRTAIRSALAETIDWVQANRDFERKNWLELELSAIYSQINVLREQEGKQPVSYNTFCTMEMTCAGHSDYRDKLLLRATVMILDLG